MSLYSAYHRMFDINSFADIEKRYNETKPIAGKNAHLNIIPVDDRKRKWEHIEKISDDCYAIYDGELGDPLPSRWGSIAGNKCLTPEVSLALAPILWTRVKDGYTIRIRNGVGDYAHVSRYSFLNRAMPLGLRFVQTGNGRQYITCGGVDYYLPKSSYHPNSREYSDERMWTTAKDDHHYLTFFHEHPIKNNTGRTYGWVPHTNTFTFQHPKSRVDKEEKAKHKANTDKFWDWICAVAPLMPVTGNWNTPERVNYDTYNNRMADEANEYLNSLQPIPSVRYYGNHGYGTVLNGNSEHCAEVVKEMMADEEHPLRLPMAWAFVNKVNGGEYHYGGGAVNKFASVSNQEEASKLRARYNSWINAQLNLVKHHEPSKVIVSDSLTERRSK
jgi:hypothetical protein